MQDKKSQEKTKPLPELEKEITEILVANGRSFQPFIKTFSYSGENVSKVNLGILLGVFEVDEKSEDSAYIVNFLASVAKKEYFNNPRRGAVESFEAALHKVNLALAELVKHGNVAWLGKLHGALGVLEKNNLHFSVTGSGKIFLLRNGTFSDISEGLASEEATTHPIKTFIEVSSGRLMLRDQIVLSSPELFSLFSPNDIEKQAARMDEARFSQFLKTALRNELDMAGTLLVTVKDAAPKTSEKKREKSLPHLENVFSQSAFNSQEQKPEPASSLNFEQKKEEYVDTKTGHIYVQGAIPSHEEGSPFMDNLKLTLQDLVHSAERGLSIQQKWLRKMRKQLLLASSDLAQSLAAVSRRTYRMLRKQWRKTLEAKRKDSPDPIASLEQDFRETENTQVSFALPDKEEPLQEETFTTETAYDEEILPEKDQNEEEIPNFLREKLAKFYNQDKDTPSAAPRPEASFETKVSSFFEKIISLPFWKSGKEAGRHFISLCLRLLTFLTSSVTILIQTTTTFVSKLPLVQRNILIGACLGIIILGSLGAYAWKKISNNVAVSEETPKEESAVSQITPALDEKNMQPLSASSVIISLANLVTSVTLDNEIYAITDRNIVNVRSHKTYTTPGSSPVQFASAMDDLRLIFLLTEDKKLYAWSPINGAFTENSLSLPENARIEAIGTYLTYLYVLESTTDQIYRFPRAESGFGQGTTWLKDFVSIENESRMSVNETIYLSPTPATLQAYFRGRLTKTLEVPNTALSLTDTYTHPGMTNMYALDTEHRRILSWNEEGVLTRQYVNEGLSQAKTLTVNEQTNEFFIATLDNNLLSFKFER